MLHKPTLALPLRKNELKEKEEKIRPFSRGHRISQISISRCLLQPFIPSPTVEAEFLAWQQMGDQFIFSNLFALIEPLNTTLLLSPGITSGADKVG